MKKIIVILISILSVISCAKKDDNTMYVNAKIRGLKKGTFYLQKQIDSLIVSIDSVAVNGTDNFILTDKIESPEMYYLTLANSDKKIPFFGEKDTVTIISSLKRFGFKNDIKGSENQELLDKYYSYMQRFNNQNLNLVKADFDAKKSANQDSIALIAKQKKNLIKRKYLYSINFAINHADHEVAPYIALSELNYVQTKWLDSIYNSLTPQIKKSKYGEELKDFIGKVKSKEK